VDARGSAVLSAALRKEVRGRRGTRCLSSKLCSSRPSPEAVVAVVVESLGRGVIHCAPLTPPSTTKWEDRKTDGGVYKVVDAVDLAYPLSIYSGLSIHFPFS
jgi:hypothetical protein